MTRIRGKAVLTLAALALSASFLLAQQSVPDLILYNGKIFTSDAAHPYVQALAIRGDRIVATGESNKIKGLAGPQPRKSIWAGAL